MSEDIICGKCPEVYTPLQIKAVYGEESTTLAALAQRPREASRRKWVWVRGRQDKKRSGSAFRPDDLGGIENLRNWTFYCPKEHIVDANSGVALPLAVLGESGSSKTHFLPALVYELRDLNVLRQVGVRLRPATYSNPELENNKDTLYIQGRELPRTERGALEGPFGYKLVVSPSPTAQAAEYVLQLFDVAGENLASVVEIASSAKFIYLCRGLIVLLDPAGVVQSAFDQDGITQQVLIRNQTNVRNSIATLADALEAVWRRPVSQLGIPIAFVIAKADSIDWTFNYRGETTAVLAGMVNGQGLREALAESSARVREAYAGIGGSRIVDEIEDRFPLDYVRFVAASATSQMPDHASADGRVWSDAQPNGVSLAVCHLLEMLGALS